MSFKIKGDVLIDKCTWYESRLKWSRYSFPDGKHMPVRNAVHEMCQKKNVNYHRSKINIPQLKPYNSRYVVPSANAINLKKPTGGKEKQ